jgi:hypothetical protein
MENERMDIDTLLSDAGDFLETRTTLFKLKAIESLVDVSGELVSNLALIVLASFVVILFSIAFALLLGNWLGEMYYGFFIIGGVYSIAALIIYAKRNQWLKDPFSNMLIRKILK